MWPVWWTCCTATRKEQRTFALHEQKAPEKTIVVLAVVVFVSTVGLVCYPVTKLTATRGLSSYTQDRRKPPPMNPFTEKLLAAVRLAVEAHDGQKRKGSGAPYVLHPLRVASLVSGASVAEPQAHEAMILAAVLHDTLEDTAIDAEELRKRFGEDVAALVEHLTQDKSKPRDERRRGMIEHCGAMPRKAQTIKLADRLDNLREIENMPQDFVERYCGEARQMLEQMRGACPELEREILGIVESCEKAGD